MLSALFRIPWGKLLVAIAYLIAVIGVPLSVEALNYYNKAAIPGQPFEAPAYIGALPSPPTPDPTKKTAVVLSSAYGSEITDTLPPFEILARSGAFNTYSVAPERDVLPLGPGPVMGATSLDFVPHFSFKDYDAIVGAPPDLIVVPEFPGYAPERDAAVLDWIRGHFGPRTTLLAICDGIMPVADTGLLDGHTYTTNPGDFDYAAAHAPSATLLQNLRYVDDGSVVSSSAVASGIDATLHVVDRFAGRKTALDVNRQLGYTQTGWLDAPSFDPPTATRFEMGLLTGFEVRQQLGVPVYDGVSEFGLAGLLDPEVGSTSARAFVMAPERRIVRGATGFLFVPRFTFSTVPALDRVLVPAGTDNVARQQVLAAWSAGQGRPPAEDIYQSIGRGESAYEATLQDLARTRSGPLAQTIADTLFYQLGATQFAGAAWPIGDILAAAAFMLLGASVVFAVTHFNIPRRTRMRVQPQPA
ncbi:MAG: DJ-1/PfpI family protein [Chloroflexi bacterium]|nr:DJ-1/PfpI family protein [Chloroflexota bacterium]